MNIGFGDTCHSLEVGFGGGEKLRHVSFVLVCTTTAANNNGPLSTTRYVSKGKQKRGGGTAAHCALDSIEQSILQGFDVLLDANFARLVNGHSSTFKTMETLVVPTIIGTTSSYLSSSKLSSAVPPPTS